jgi:4-alpha-glucanotransferase
MLTRSLDAELAADLGSRQDWVTLLESRGLVPVDPTPEQIVIGLHRLLAQVPARMLCVALVDVVGDRRTQNQPGTIDEYPNWRVPLSDSTGTLLTLEDVFESATVREFLASMGN